MNTIVFDNGGQTCDRYTILDKKTGDIWGASTNPFHPLGFGQYCGNVADNYWFHAYGSGWRNYPNVKRMEKFAIDRFIREFTGPKVKIDTLPDPVKRYIEQLAETVA